MMAELAGSPLRQINLYNDALLPKRELFSARQMTTWTVIALISMIAIAWWAVVETRKIAVEVANQASRQTVERARNAAVLPAGEVPSPQQLAASEQALRAQEAQLAARRAAGEALSRGMANDKRGPSALMRLIAATIPPQVWVTEVRVAGSQVDVIGKTLDPVAINIWLERLRASAYVVAKPLPVLRLERVDAPNIAPTTAPSPAPGLGRVSATSLASAGTPVIHSFTISAGLSSPFAEEGPRP